MNQPTTTLTKIKAAGPCVGRWRRTLRKAGGLRKYGADTPITIRQIVDAMGVDDALWCLRTMPEYDWKWRLLAVRYARRIQYLIGDARSIHAMDVAERYAGGLATDEDLLDARIMVMVIITEGEQAWAAPFSTVDPRGWNAARYAARDAAMVIASRAAEAAARSVAIDDSAAYAAKARKKSFESEREWQAAELIRICEEAA